LAPFAAFCRIRKASTFFEECPAAATAAFSLAGGEPSLPIPSAHPSYATSTIRR
jgi:hypothetical protein